VLAVKVMLDMLDEKNVALEKMAPVRVPFLVVGLDTLDSDAGAIIARKVSKALSTYLFSEDEVAVVSNPSSPKDLFGEGFEKLKCVVVNGFYRATLYRYMHYHKFKLGPELSYEKLLNILDNYPLHPDVTVRCPALSDSFVAKLTSSFGEKNARGMEFFYNKIYDRSKARSVDPEYVVLRLCKRLNSKKHGFGFSFMDPKKFLWTNELSDVELVYDLPVARLCETLTVDTMLLLSVEGHAFDFSRPFVMACAKRWCDHWGLSCEVIEGDEDVRDYVDKGHDVLIYNGSPCAALSKFGSTYEAPRLDYTLWCLASDYMVVGNEGFSKTYIKKVALFSSKLDWRPFPVFDGRQFESLMFDLCLSKGVLAKKFGDDLVPSVLRFRVPCLPRKYPPMIFVYSDSDAVLGEACALMEDLSFLEEWQPCASSDSDASEWRFAKYKVVRDLKAEDVLSDVDVVRIVFDQSERCEWLYRPAAVVYIQTPDLSVGAKKAPVSSKWTDDEAMMKAYQYSLLRMWAGTRVIMYKKNRAVFYQKFKRLIGMLFQEAAYSERGEDVSRPLEVTRSKSSIPELTDDGVVLYMWLRELMREDVGKLHSEDVVPMLCEDAVSLMAGKHARCDELMEAVLMKMRENRLWSFAKCYKEVCWKEPAWTVNLDECRSLSLEKVVQLIAGVKAKLVKFDQEFMTVPSNVSVSADQATADQPKDGFEGEALKRENNPPPLELVVDDESKRKEMEEESERIRAELDKQEMEEKIAMTANEPVFECDDGSDDTEYECDDEYKNAECKKDKNADCKKGEERKVTRSSNKADEKMDTGAIDGIDSMQALKTYFIVRFAERVPRLPEDSMDFRFERLLLLYYVEVKEVVEKWIEMMDDDLRVGASVMKDEEFSKLLKRKTDMICWQHTVADIFFDALKKAKKMKGG